MGERRGGGRRWAEDGLVRERRRRGVEVDRGIVSPGPSGATTAAWEPRISGNPARWGGPGPLSACRLGGGRAKGREHMILV